LAPGGPTRKGWFQAGEKQGGRDWFEKVSKASKGHPLREGVPGKAGCCVDPWWNRETREMGPGGAKWGPGPWEKPPGEMGGPLKSKSGARGGGGRRKTLFWGGGAPGGPRENLGGEGGGGELSNNITRPRKAGGREDPPGVYPAPI